MSIPKRHSSPENIKSRQRTFFVTTSTDGKRGLLQTERMAMLLIDVMFHYRNQGEYKLHEFVVMRKSFSHPDYRGPGHDCGTSRSAQQRRFFLSRAESWELRERFGNAASAKIA